MTRHAHQNAFHPAAVADGSFAHKQNRTRRLKRPNQKISDQIQANHPTLYIHANQIAHCSTFLRRRPSLSLCAASSGCHKGEDGSFVTSGIQDLTFREEFAGKNH